MFGFVSSAAKWAGRQLGHGAKAVAHGASAVGKTASKAVHTLDHVPVVGTALHVTLAITPLGLADKLAAGARIDRAVMADFRDKIAAAREVAPYASTVVSFVPGIGTGVAAAIAAGAVLAEGRPITEAVLAATKAALPGGAIAAAGFDVAQGLAHGQNVTQAALTAARNRLPPAGQAAFDVGLALASGKKLQDALLKGVAAMGAAELSQMAAAGARALGANPILTKARELVPAIERRGFDVGAGMMAHSGVSPEALELVRRKLSQVEQAGFDAALKTRTEQVRRAVLAQAAPERVLLAIRSVNPKKRAAAATFLRQTEKAARMGDPESKRSMLVIRAVHRADARHAPVVVDVQNGRLLIRRGIFEVKS